MVIIAAGSNKSFCGQPPMEIVTRAMTALAAVAGTGQRVSPLYRSPAWPDPAEPAYVNAVCVFEQSEHSPASLLALLHAIEDGFGRERAYLADPALRYAPRTLDLDLIAHGDAVLDSEGGGPVLPHPAMAARDFVLAPLCDLAPDWRHPVTGRCARAMLGALPEKTARRLSPSA